MKSPNMNFFKLISLLFLCLLFLHCSQKIPRAKAYLAQEKPTLTPQIFAKGIISKPNQSEFGSVFSKNGDDFFYGVDIDGKAEIRYSKLVKGKWTEPTVIINHDKYSFNDPFLSPDEQELYYISNQPTDRIGPAKDYDIWYSKKTKKGWSLPINAGSNINSAKDEYYISFTNGGKMYFSSNVNTEENQRQNFDIYTSERIDGKYQTKQQLEGSINSNAYEADVFVAPDESYLIFCANRREVGLGRGDLYISFKDKNGNWTPSKNMDTPINSANHELCPFVTADGNYFFYTSNKDIYWVSTEIFEQYRPKN